MTLGVTRGADSEPVHVAFRSGKVAGDWERRHARGEVPGAWPYGLEGLERALSALAVVHVRAFPPAARAGPGARRGCFRAASTA